MERVTLKVGGMTCGHCVAQVTTALTRVSGAQVERVEVGSATVSYDPNRTSGEGLARAIEEQGYTVTGTKVEDHPENER